MGIRDKEIQRLTQYAKGLGITVSFKNVNSDGCRGTWDHKPPSITVYTYEGQSKTAIILILLHELGHHLDWIYRKKKISKRLIEALHRENTWNPGDKKIPKSLRRWIYESEYDGTAYMPVIAKELDLKVPMWKVEAEVELDRWVAKQFLIHGEYPTFSETQRKRSQIRQKY